MLIPPSVARLAVLAGAPVALLAAWLVAGAPSTSAGPTYQATASVQAGDYYFAAPDSIEGGLVTLQFSNAGRETHHAQLVRLPDDVTFDQFAAALAGDERAGLGLVHQVGGAAAVDAGRSTEVTVDLQPGIYALICVIPSPSDRVRHFAKGMVTPLVVTAPTTATAAPEASGTIAIRDFAIDMPETIPAGRTTYRVVNEGPAQPHELAIVRLKPGVTAADARQAIMTPAGPPPFEAVGGFQAIEVGGEGFVALDLEPGEYAAICRVTEPLSGQSHVHLGMVKGFRVE